MLLPWISVTESMPAAHDEVLFWATDPWHPEQNKACMGYWEIGPMWFDNSRCDRDGDPSDEYHVTHWLPITGPSKAHQE